MRFTKAFSVIAAYTMLAMSNAAAIPTHDNLSVTLARLDAAKADIAKVMHARDVIAPATVPPAVASDIANIVSSSTLLTAAIVALVTDLSSDPFDTTALTERSTDTITSDAMTLASDITQLISDVAKLATDAGVPDNIPAPKFPGFPF